MKYQIIYNEKGHNRIPYCNIIFRFFDTQDIVSFNRDLSRKFGIPILLFSPSVHEIHFQKKFFEANLPFIPPEYHTMNTKCTN